jgi:hypothetical protein
MIWANLKSIPDVLLDMAEAVEAGEEVEELTQYNI